ncbi:Uncharacterized protein GBIM_03501 [Gryllus bimaculatus]|nr:Uncharacterized protein GBIM_03501 [Gryllus bimaculatus]
MRSRSRSRSKSPRRRRSRSSSRDRHRHSQSSSFRSRSISKVPDYKRSDKSRRYERDSDSKHKRHSSPHRDRSYEKRTRSPLIKEHKSQSPSPARSLSQRKSIERHTHGEGLDAEFWPHDKYVENQQPGHASSSGYGHYGYRDRHRRNPETFMDQRRQERERIGLAGVPQVWGKSPPRVDDSDEMESIVNEGIKKNAESDSSDLKKKKKRKKEKKAKKSKKHKKDKKSKKKKRKKQESSSSLSSSSSSGEECELWVEKNSK